MQLLDKIEKRRFVGREFLLFLWFESELFDATLRTQKHGSFGLWLEKRLTLSEGKRSTRITALQPGQGREAKEALLAGQLPESAAIRIAWRDDEMGFLLKAEQLAVGGLKLPTALDQESEAPSALLEEMKGGALGRGKRKLPKADDEAHEAFYERMQLTEEFEGLLEALYADFCKLRLSEAWPQRVVPLLRAWAKGEEFDADGYAAFRHGPAPKVGPKAATESTKVGPKAATESTKVGPKAATESTKVGPKAATESTKVGPKAATESTKELAHQIDNPSMM